MAQLLQTVKFKTLSSELTDNEFDEFLCSLRRVKGRQFILRSLCQQQQHPSPTADLLQIVSNIIQKRRNQRQPRNPWTLDTLPKSFIGEIASNLGQLDYAHFSRANRAIFIGCNDPNRLLSLSLMGSPPSSLIRFDRFPHLQKLSICPSALRSLGGEHHIPGQLKSFGLQHFHQESDWLSIVQRRTLDYPILRTLFLHSCTFPSVNTARQLFAKFSMVHHLYLTSTEWVGNVSIPTALVTKSFPNLNSLTVRRCEPLAYAFLKCRGPDLHQLDLNALQSSRFNELKKISFLKLRRLRIQYGVPSEMIQHIVNSASNLASACYIASYLARQTENDEISQFIDALLTRKENFSDLFLYLYRAEQLECVSKEIECALQTTRKWKRKLMRIGFQYWGQLKVSEAVVIISRILTRLSLCNIDEYSLFMKLQSGDDKKESLIKDVNELVDDLENVELVRSESCAFIIRKKGSKINSYKMWWNEAGPYESKLQVIY